MRKKNIKTEGIAVSDFRKAIEATPDVAVGYRPGLQALRSVDKVYVVLADTDKIEGSLDIDTCTKKLYPGSNRWDYAISYKGKVYYVEVHPADTSNVKIMMSKLAWLKQWLLDKAPEINKLPKSEPSFFWVATNAGIHIPPTSIQYKNLAINKLLPIKVLRVK